MSYEKIPIPGDFDSLTQPQDGSGWTPLMIAASLKAAEGDKIIDLLLRKGADVSMKSNTGQVSYVSKGSRTRSSGSDSHRMLCTLQVPKPTSPLYGHYSPINAVPASKIFEASCLFTGLQQSVLFPSSRLSWKRERVPSMRRITMG